MTMIAVMVSMSAMSSRVNRSWSACHRVNAANAKNPTAPAT